MIKQISPKALHETLDNVALIDVREHAEFENQSIPQARHVPLSNIHMIVNDTEKDTPIVLHCKSGMRSMLAANELSKLGFTHLSNLEGGIIAWEKAGFPTNTNKTAQPFYQSPAFLLTLCTCIILYTLIQYV